MQSDQVVFVAPLSQSSSSTSSSTSSGGSSASGRAMSVAIKSLNPGLRLPARVLACSPSTAAGGGSGGASSTPQKGGGESTFKKFVVSGVVASGYEFCMGHQLEFLKIMKQTKPGSYVQLLKGIVGQKGIVGLVDGFFPWGLLQAIAKGAVFGGAHSFARSQLLPFVDRGEMNSMLAETLAGGIGGGFQGLVLSPTLLLKTRVMTDPIFRQNMTLWETSKQSAKVGVRVIQNEGVAALMKGSITFSLKRVADWSSRFLFATMAEDMLFEKGDAAYKLSNGEQLSASLVGGTISALVTLPLDVMVAQIQQASKAGQKVGVLQTFHQEWKVGGWERVAGFASKGFLARALHVALTTAIMKNGCTLVYDWLYGDDK